MWMKRVVRCGVWVWLRCLGGTKGEMGGQAA